MKNKNIFENAYFGKPYKTRDGRKAIYAGTLVSTTLYRLLIEGTVDTFNYNEFGSFKPHGISKYDIVSEWQEPIDEEELGELAEEYATKYAIPHTSQFVDMTNGFKAGYRKALEQ